MPTCLCGCGAKYKVPETSLGKKAKCKKCDAVFTLEADDGVIPISPPDDDFRGTFAAEAAATAAHMPEATVPRMTTATTAAMEAIAVGKTLADRPKASRGYWDSILWTILFPADPRNIVVFVILWICLGMLQVVLWMPAVGVFLLFAKFLFGVMIFGWYCGYRFELIEGAAAGDSQLPDLNMSMDWLDEVIRPFFLWIGSWLVVITPPMLQLVFADDIRDPFEIAGIWIAAFSDPARVWEASPVAAILIYLGLFLWPMVVLTVALAGFSSLLRVDMILLSLVRSFPAYLFTFGLVAVATIADAFASARISAKMTAGQTGFAGLLGWSLLAQLLALGVSAYCAIVSLRAIGLYYHHFKHRFAWNWG